MPYMQPVYLMTTNNKLLTDRQNGPLLSAQLSKVAELRVPLKHFTAAYTRNAKNVSKSAI